MRRTTNDTTLTRNYLRKYQFLIREYELVKAKNHPRFRFVSDFYAAHQTNKQTFLKYYNRFKTTGDLASVLPGKRGPRWKSRRTPGFIEHKVLAERAKGCNRYEIFNILVPLLQTHTPKPSTIYAICRRNGVNRLTKSMKHSKQRIIKTKAGELGHIDTHYLAKGIITGDTSRYYLLGLIDSCTRLAWVEIIRDLSALTVMFATLKSLNMLTQEYQVKFAEILSDNGPEFGRKTTKAATKANHAFERLLQEMQIKHRYIRPYRPQTNGKIERFWKTLEEDVFAEMCFDNYEHLQQELTEYLYYYNHERPHQGIGGQTPALYNQNCQRIT
ncbi:MAG: integrase core domain-containing protein [Balneola sp.]